MKYTSNEERLKILQERLSQINDKSNSTAVNRSAEEKIQQKSIKKNYDDANSNINDKNIKEAKSSSKKYLLIIIGIGLISFFTYPQILEIINISNKKTNNNEVVDEIIVNEKIKYNFNMEGNIAVIDDSNDENIAKAMINALQVKGFKCNYFYLPENSNSKEEIYKIYIGPYDDPNEMRQWISNIETEVEIINL